MSIIVLRSTPQRSLADLLSSSPLCPVSILTNRHLYDSLASLVNIVSFLQLVFNTHPVNSAWHPTWRLAAAGATRFNGRKKFWKLYLVMKHRKPGSFSFCPHWVSGALTVSTGTDKSGWIITALKRWDTFSFHTTEKWAAISFLLESLLWAFTQAKGTCEDYNPVLPEGSMGSFNNSSPGPTPSAAVLEDQPVTRGTFSGGTMSGENWIHITGLEFQLNYMF